MNWGPFYEKIEKTSHNAKKIEGDPLGIFFFVKNVPQCRKTQMWDPLISPGIVCYAEKKEKHF